MVQVPLLLFCFGMVQHSLADADALNDSCTVHRIEKSMYGTGIDPNYCTPNAKRFSKIEYKKWKLAMQCYYECMKEYTITQLNETFGWLQPAVANCTMDLSDRECRAFPLNCTSPFNSFPNACSGSLGRYAPVKIGNQAGESELELYLGLYSYSRLSWFGGSDKVLETRLLVGATWTIIGGTCSSFYSTGSDSSCLCLSGESSKAVMPPKAPVPTKEEGDFRFVHQQLEFRDYQLTSCTLVTDMTCDGVGLHRESDDPEWEVMDLLGRCLRPTASWWDTSGEFRLEWHIDEGVTLLTIDKWNCPRIAMNCSKPLDAFPNACSGSFALKDRVFFMALYSYIKHDNEDQVYQAIEMRLVVDKSVCNTMLKVRSHTGACLGLRGRHKLPLEDEIDWEATESLEPPEMAEMPRPFRDPPSTSTVTVTTATVTETSITFTTKTSTSLMDVPPAEDHGKDSKPSPSEPKPPEPSKSTLWPFLKIVALSLMLLGATAAFLWYRRRQGTQAATLQTQEVEIQEIRRA